MKAVPISRRVEKHQKIITFIFFLIFLFIGLMIFDDYGISTDEMPQREYGFKNVEYMTKENTALNLHRAQYHGPVFTTFLAIAETLLKLEDTRDIYLLRHLLTFLLFYVSVVFFYLLTGRQFHSWKIGLLGSLFLILSPRIFADSFYNPKDLPLLSVFIISMYTLILYLDKKDWLTASAHALACAILIDIRILGILVPCLTFFFITLDLISRLKSKEPIKNLLLNLSIYALLLSAFTILFWPASWEDPIHHFINSFAYMKDFPWDGYNLYLGKNIGPHPPWHYIPVWMIITTPSLYTFTFLVGLIISLGSIVKIFSHFFENRNDLIFLLWFFGPLFMVIILKSNLYVGWRHMFFIYPAFLLISLKGLTFLFNLIKTKLKGTIGKLIIVLLILIIALSLFSTIRFMVKSHPHQNVYFNQLVGKDLRKEFELDYWGLSYRQAFEYITKNDPEKLIKFASEQQPSAIRNLLILLPDDRNRLQPASPEEAKYFLSNYRNHPGDYPYQDEFYSIEIDGTKIMIVYKLK